MALLKTFAMVTAEVCVAGILADVFLALIHAGIGWYYGVGYLLAMLGVARVMRQRQENRPKVSPPNA
jgi:hypothetical protein